MSFMQVWLSGLVRPSRAFDELKTKPAPLWGLSAVLIRFIITSFTTILALHLLDREPFTPPNLTFLTTDNYYAAETAFLPVFGLAMWLLGSAVVHVILRLVGKQSDFDQILNIIGLGMLIPMPIVWLWDWTMIALNWYQMTVMAVSHSICSLGSRSPFNWFQKDSWASSVDQHRSCLGDSSRIHSAGDDICAMRKSGL